LKSREQEWSHWWSDGSEEVLRDHSPIDDGAWQELVRHAIRRDLGRDLPDWDLQHVGRKIGLLSQSGELTAKAERLARTRAGAQSLAEEISETWRSMRAGYEIPHPPAEKDDDGVALGSLNADLASMQARAGYGRPGGDPETRKAWDERAYGGEPGEELGSLTADLAARQRAMGLTR
jgi:hypothetical protein